ncbi:3-isopropylmalate dehydratase large subunit, chloroplastic-like [Malus sylvestris]|uniref:3-isopropylmalate dehydratase large subunit, chloroplastic-like n=1 Tax=Malus sylvestris TaxID=3752 RepID=UPI0021ABF695|nr:3-isopropylmalate dehydratase large subunit, chloroplastic-like [Malus sylvestris]
MDGEMPDYLLAKDLILQIIGEISVSGGTYKAMEFVGSTVESLSMEERMTLCNMVIEVGGKNGVVPADSTTFKYLEDKTSVPYEPVYSDAKARGKRSKLPHFLCLLPKSLPVPGSGGKTCSQIFEEVGCDTPASPSCGACLGGPKDTYARLNEPQRIRARGYEPVSGVRIPPRPQLAKKGRTFPFGVHDRDSGPKAMKFGRGSFVEMEWPYFFFLFIYLLFIVNGELIKYSP